MILQLLGETSVDPTPCRGGVGEDSRHYRLRHQWSWQKVANTTSSLLQWSDTLRQSCLAYQPHPCWHYRRLSDLVVVRWRTSWHYEKTVWLCFLKTTCQSNNRVVIPVDSCNVIRSVVLTVEGAFFFLAKWLAVLQCTSCKAWLSNSPVAQNCLLLNSISSRWDVNEIIKVHTMVVRIFNDVKQL